LGENGAGKSTLIKILAGVHRPDEGRIVVAGEALPDAHLPADATARGLHFVHQDLGLVDELSVAENIALETGYATWHGLVAMRRTERRATELLARQGVEIDPRKLVAELPQAERVMVAIARAFHADARAIVLDEVTASLPGPEADRLATAVRTARDSGVGFIWVTHRLDELPAFADRLTVLRDGRSVATAAMIEASIAQIVEWIVGRPVTTAPLARARRPQTREPRLTVSELTGPGIAEPVSFGVAAGEVVGITGLIGCGAHEVARMLGGSPRLTGGTAVLDGRALPLGSPSAMRKEGCAYVPGDRTRDGALPALTVRENLFVARVGSGADNAFIRRPGRERAATERLIETYGVRPRQAAEMPLDTLSGGNQQKVIFGRALRTAPRLIILIDPTSGVDVGARAELYTLLRGAAESGAAVVLASTDFDEVVAEAHRALVMVRGRVASELTADDLTREHLAAASYATRDTQESPA
jgi:ribose transport system ATP-binding protein